MFVLLAAYLGLAGREARRAARPYNAFASLIAR